MAISFCWFHTSGGDGKVGIWQWLLELGAGPGPRLFLVTPGRHVPCSNVLVHAWQGEGVCYWKASASTNPVQRSGPLGQSAGIATGSTARMQKLLVLRTKYKYSVLRRYFVLAVVSIAKGGPGMSVGRAYQRVASLLPCVSFAQSVASVRSSQPTNTGRLVAGSQDRAIDMRLAVLLVLFQRTDNSARLFTPFPPQTWPSNSRQQVRAHVPLFGTLVKAAVLGSNQRESGGLLPSLTFPWLCHRLDLVLGQGHVPCLTCGSMHDMQQHQQ